MAWAASPSNATRPLVHAGSGVSSRSGVRMIACGAVAWMMAGIGSCQLAKRSSSSSRSSASEPSADSGARAEANQ